MTHKDRAQFFWDEQYDMDWSHDEMVKRLSEHFLEVAEQEREVCAEIAEAAYGDGAVHAFNYDDGGTTFGYDKACGEIAKAIRARGES